MLIRFCFCISAVLLMAACSHSDTAPRPGMEAVPAEQSQASANDSADLYAEPWYELVIGLKQNYVLEPCNGDIPSLEFLRQNGNISIVYSPGQVASEYKVLHTRIHNSTHYTFKCLGGAHSDSTRFDIELEGGEMYCTMNGEAERRAFAPKSRLGMYEHRMQPCRECWGDDTVFCNEKR